VEPRPPTAAEERSVRRCFTCVHCGNAVPALYIEYSPRNIRLCRCDKCGKEADPFVEMGTLEIVVAAILHRPLAYVHAIHNRGSLGGVIGVQLRNAMLRVPLLASALSWVFPNSTL
jgi:NAD-dependent SIR2 family protein deacetylase